MLTVSVAYSVKPNTIDRRTSVLLIKPMLKLDTTNDIAVPTVAWLT